MAEDRVSIEEGVVYGTGGGRDLRCDVFRPPTSTSSNGAARPAVMLVHGGGWRTGDRTQLRGYGILLGRAGYVCIAPEYRLLGESPWPAAIEDVKAAIRWVRASSALLGIDTDRIAIEGNSAGAHLALLAAGTPGVEALAGSGGNAGVDESVAAAIGVYAPTLFLHDGHNRGSLPFLALDEESGTPEGAQLASPISHITPSFPPTMLIHGTQDELVPVEATLVMYEALAAAGVPAELHLYADQRHAFDADPQFGRQCAAEMDLFLSRYLRAPAASAATASVSGAAVDG